MATREEIARRRAQLAARQSKLGNTSKDRLSERLQFKETEAQAAIPKRDPSKPTPLSTQQQRLWFLDQFQPGNVVYSIPLPLRVTGPLNVVALERSFGETLKRHENLRTRFPALNAQPVQEILEPTPFHFTPCAPDAAAPHDHPMIDLRPTPQAEREALAQALLRDEAIKPFDLTNGPVMRVVLLQMEDEHFYLLVNTHHIATDGWSVTVLVREMVAGYQAFCQNQEPDLPPLQVQYADYAAWQRQWLAGDDFKRKLDWWKQMLGENPPVVDLPTDRPRPVVQTTRGSFYGYRLNPTIAEGLKQLGRERNVTLFMLLTAALKTLIHRYSRQADVVIGTTIANRGRLELEALIGFFVNTLPLRTDFTGVDSVTTLLERVRDVVTGAFANQDVPFDQLVDQLLNQRDPSRAPLVQVILTLQNMPPKPMPIAGMLFETITLHQETARVDLTVTAVEQDPRGFIITLEYNTDLWDEGTIARMCGHLANLLGGMVQHPELAPARLPMLSVAERRQLLVDWVPSYSGPSPQQTLHARFEYFAEQTPNAAALSFEGERLSYAELNRHAQQIAHELRRLGVRPGELIALLLERSLEMPAAILGVLKSGAAYLPIDPVYPGERMRFMLEDSETKIWLVQRAVLEEIPGGFEGIVPDGVTLHFLEPFDDSERPSAPIEAGFQGLGVDQPAYVIYTSGSTGRPKGVQIAHAHVKRLFLATDHWYQFNADDVWTLFHSFAFDVSVWELWGAFLYGGRLVVVPRLIARAPEQFYQLLHQEQVTVLSQTPSAFYRLIWVENIQAVSVELALRYVVFGGEALDLNALNPWFERHGDCKPLLVNMYGITETTVHSTFRPITMADVARHAGSVVGTPIPDLPIYLLDEHMEPVPIGVPGEIFVAGSGVARGYLKRPDLTAQRFVPNPFSQKPDRLYRSGDLARYRDDGDMEYIGRIDFQVKIRGFRIELGEIEERLTRHQDVKTAVVLVREMTGNQVLVAYFVSGENTPGVNALRRHLGDSLPDYMVPAHFVHMDSIPMTANGKVDRRSLPEPDLARPDLDEAFTGPDSNMEAVLAEVWAESLGLDRVGVNDNFFALGGDSMRSIQVLAKLRERGINLDLQLLFKYQTVRELARGIAATSDAASLSEPTAPFALLDPADKTLLPQDVIDAWPLSVNQLDMLKHTRENPTSPLFHEASSLHLRTHLDAATLREAWRQVVHEHPVLRAHFDFDAYSEPLQLVRAQVQAEVAILDWRDMGEAAQEEALADWLAAQIRLPFNWDKPPLVRFHIHRRTHDSFHLTMDFHRALLDGWSQASLRANLLTRYKQLLDHKEKGGPISAGATGDATRPADFVQLERELLKDPRAVEFWVSRFSDVHAAPIPRLGESQQADFDQEHHRRMDYLPIPLSESLKKLSSALGVPLKSVLLAAHFHVMAAFTGRNDVVTGMEVNARPETQAGEKALGMFLVDLPLRLKLERGDWRDLIRRAQETEWEMLPYRRFPAARLESLLQRRNLFEVLFIFSHFHVYKQLERVAGFEVLARGGAELYPYPLVVTFNVDIASAHIRLITAHDDTLSAQQVDLLINWYTRALEAMVADPNSNFADHHPISPEERTNLLTRWNQARDSALTDGSLKVDDLDLDQHPLYLLGDDNRPVLPGVAGELCFGDIHTQNARTEADPFKQDALMIRTGQWAMLDRAGKLVFTESVKPETEDLPLSYAQERLWFIHKLEGAGYQYNVPFAQIYNGPFDVDAFTRGIELIVQRHETLRTNFIERDGRPRLLIHDSPPHPLRVVDLSLLPGDDGERVARALGYAETIKIFHLEDEPLMRCFLLRMAPQRHLFLMNIHHIITDGVSMNAFLGELITAYRAFVNGAEPELPTLTLQYVEYARRQRRWLSGEVLENQLQFWRDALAGAPPVLELPTDKPRPALKSYEGAGHVFHIPAETAERFNAFCRERGITLFMGLLGVYQLLLARYAGSADFVVGTSVANRNRRELQRLIGFFVNTLPLRALVPGDQNVNQLMAGIRERVLAAFAHQDLPFEKIVEALKPERHLNRSPIYQVAFVLQNTGNDDDFTLPGLSVENVLEASSIAARFDLILEMVETGRGIMGTLEYGADLYGPETIARMAKHYAALLEAVMDAPESPVVLLDPLDQAEREHILRDFNQVEAGTPRSRTLHQDLVRQAQATPNARALAADGFEMTYAELNARANQIAHHLIAHGVGPECVVGVFMERGPVMVAALYGVLKAGGAYLPLAPDYPSERLAYMLEDSGAAMLLKRGSEGHEPPPYEGTVLCLDDQSVHLDNEPEHDPPERVLSENLAYSIYTSGSTGRPKGVLLPHRGAVNLIEAVREGHALTVQARVLQFASQSFDASVCEIFSTLAAGAELHLASRQAMMPGPDLARLINQRGITHITLTPSSLARLEPNEVTSLTTLIVAGEACPIELAQRWSQDRRFVNAYGPTEATVCSTLAACTGENGLLPIGGPIPNVRVYVLDDLLRPVPIGVAGELYIGGIGLARGYRQRPDLTAAGFVPNPFDGDGERLYRSGDRVRFDAEGQLHFLGRIDHQVKVRGFRIELGEIEQTILTHPQVAQVVVTTRAYAADDTRLMAYLVVDKSVEEPAGLIEALRGSLALRLPDYMMPAAFIPLEAMPLNPSGKIDQAALPKVEDHLGETEGEITAPATPTEQIVVRVWAELLGLPQISTRANFFELGGHSLLGMQVVSHLRKELGVEVPVQLLFEAPTAVGFSARVDQLLGRQETRQLPPILPIPEETPESKRPPLSFAQQRLWFLFKLDPENTAYNMPAVMRLQGRLDLPALQHAIDEIVRRHEPLRTTFNVADGQPYQVIHPPGPTPIKMVDLSHFETSARDEHAHLLIQAEANRVFHLVHGPLGNLTLLRLSPDHHLFVTNMHHIIFDGWSQGILVRELAQLYTPLGEPPQLETPTVSYADYSYWQHRWLRGEVLGRQIEYWKTQLSDAPSLHDIMTDRPRPARQTFGGDTIGHRMDAQLTAQLNQLARDRGVSLFMLLEAAYATLVYRYARRPDVVIGTPIANRHYQETEPLIGFFVNTLVLRNDLSPEPGLSSAVSPSFQTLLTRTRQVTLDAYANQDVPFEQVVDAVQPERNMGYSPLFQIMLILQNLPDEELTLPGIRLEPLYGEGATAKFDFNLSFTEGPEGLDGALEYNVDLFNAATMTRLMGHFEVLLRGVVADPDQPIARLPILDSDELATMLVQWNDKPGDFPRHTCINELFEQQVARTPDAVALLHENRQLSYAALDRRGNRLAHHLQSLGVGPETLVGVFAQSSIPLIEGLVGINKAGGAYLPLDPTYPTDRIAYMIEEGQVDVLLTQSGLRDRLPEFDGTIIYLDEADFTAYPSHKPISRATADNLVYVIYTSGSTGRPKGVQIEHWTVASLCFGQDYVDYTNTTRVVLQMAPISFDASTFELWGVLLHGRTCALYPERVANVELLGGALHRYVVDTLWLTTPLFNFVVDEAPDTLRYVRQVLVGGESLSVPHVRRAQEALPRLQVINAYGPTENTCFTTCYPIPRGLPDDAVSITLGGPVNNCQLYIVDEWLQPVPIGVPGELYIGGDGVQRGYRNRPRLNAEVLIPNPFSGVPGSRLYKVNDLCRWLPDGTVDILGRTDNQVKIRGFRIELGEIEACLLKHQGIREAVVMPREDVPGNKQLVGYVQLTEKARVAETPLDEAALRVYLKEILPEYMVPTAIVVLDAFPFTPNGKVDRRALPAPALVEGGGAFIAPRTHTEEIIAGIWAETLGKPKVSVDADFFDMGGHSLMATQIISRIEEAFEVAVPLRTVFEAPTVAGLASRVDVMEKATHRQAQGGSILAGIQPSGETGDAPLSFAQQRLWFLFQLDPNNTAYNMPAAFQLKGRLDLAQLNWTLNALVQRHEPLRTTFRVRGGKPVQVVADSYKVPLPLIDLRGLSEVERETTIREVFPHMARHVFNLTRGPLLKAFVMRLDDQNHVMLFNMHHIISDGWSMGVLTRELGALYTPIGEARSLPPLPVSYADFSRWQHRELAGEVLDRQLAYWRQRLQGAPALHDIPTDRPRPAVQNFDGASMGIHLDNQLAQALNQLSRKSAATLFMTLQAAFAVLVSRYARQDDVVIGTPVANRNHKEIEPLIGFFINNLVLRNDMRPGPDDREAPSFNEMLARSRRTALEAYAHQDVPFEKIVDAVQPERNMGYSPLFQIMLILQNTPTGAMDLPGLTLEPLAEEVVAARFDLMLSFSEDATGLSGGLEYNTYLFHEATVRRFLDHYQVLLREVVADPGRPISRLPIIGEAERAMMLEVWNYKPGHWPRDICVHELFEQQAARTPDAVALLHENRQLSYAALDRRGNRLAHHLQSLGVGPETLVGVFAESSIPLIEGLVGINKAGGAYLPLDPTYPADRVAYMIEEGRVDVLLTQSHLVERVPDFQGTVICLDQADFSHYPSVKPPCRAQADNLVYVIYTSGSTGRPKGVQIEHWTVAALCFGQDYVDYAGTTKVVLQMAPISFDASTFELWGVLLFGRTCALYPERVANVELLGGALHRYVVDTLWLTTPLFNFVIDEAPDTLRYVRQVLVGGESLSVPHVRRAQKALPRLQVINAYGPTENTCFTTCYPIPRELPADTAAITLGGPINNCQLYIVDDQLQPVPIGVPGELYIGGDGVQRGYRDRPRLNAEVLIPNPFSGVPGSRLYKVYDLCRWLPDGTVDILGRTDHQVKIRGFRIELGEIESALLHHPLVREAVVVVRGDGPATRQLVGYVQPVRASAEDEVFSTANMRSYLKQRLPDYMVPTLFVFLADFPFTPNGKVDRRALPEPVDRPSSEYVAPRNETESELAHIWADLLKLERVGIEDNFFDLGGHSLLAARVIAWIRDSFGVALPLRTVFEAPTVAALAARIETASGDQDEAGPIPRIADDAPVPATFSQLRMWHRERKEGASGAYNMPNSLLFNGVLDVALLEDVIRGIVARHESLRAVFAETAEYGVVMRIDAEPVFDLSFVDLRGLAVESDSALVRALAQADVSQPFNLVKGPLLRACLIRLSDQQHALLISMHHIISDGWSVSLFSTELAAAYAARVLGGPSPLPELPIRFRDYAVWLRGWLTPERLEAQLQYWLQQLEGAPPLLNLPLDRPRPAVQEYRGSIHSTMVPAELVKQTTQLGKKLGGTLFSVLQTVYALLLSQYGGQEDIVIATPVANRNRKEIEPLIGLFLNAVLLRNDLSGDPSFSELGARTSKIVLDAFANQDIPLAQTIGALEPEVDPSYTPVFQTMFVLQNTPEVEGGLPGLSLSGLDPGEVTVKYDLAFTGQIYEGDLALSFEYKKGLFEESTIIAIGEHFKHLLEAITKNPEERISALPKPR